MISGNELNEIDQDINTTLRLAVDDSDPPRYYVLDRDRRCELVAIGDAPDARRQFARRIVRWKQRRKKRT